MQLPHAHCVSLLWNFYVRRTCRPIKQDPRRIKGYLDFRLFNWLIYKLFDSCILRNWVLLIKLVYDINYIYNKISLIYWLWYLINNLSLKFILNNIDFRYKIILFLNPATNCAALLLILIYFKTFWKTCLVFTIKLFHLLYIII